METQFFDAYGDILPQEMKEIDQCNAECVNDLELDHEYKEVSEMMGEGEATELIAYIINNQYREHRGEDPVVVLGDEARAEQLRLRFDREVQVAYLGAISTERGVLHVDGGGHYASWFQSRWVPQQGWRLLREISAVGRNNRWAGLVTRVIVAAPKKFAK